MKRIKIPISGERPLTMRLPYKVGISVIHTGDGDLEIWCGWYRATVGGWFRRIKVKAFIRRAYKKMDEDTRREMRRVMLDML